ncbi:unnamed protein product [Owenia fusiformis]|uniref:Uncharacterized protein n=1 Tax=Owenia fusiformis TaxID=6347 RepID=A0A8J1T7S3_OWEFU|nr:unnamed protein product [Owenia fusiformis]
MDGSLLEKFKKEVNALKAQSDSLNKQMWLLYVTFEDFMITQHPERAEQIMENRLNPDDWLNYQTRCFGNTDTSQIPPDWKYDIATKCKTVHDKRNKRARRNTDKAEKSINSEGKDKKKSVNSKEMNRINRRDQSKVCIVDMQERHVNMHERHHNTNERHFITQENISKSCLPDFTHYKQLSPLTVSSGYGSEYYDLDVHISNQKQSPSNKKEDLCGNQNLGPKMCISHPEMTELYPTTHHPKQHKAPHVDITPCNLSDSTRLQDNGYNKTLNAVDDSMRAIISDLKTQDAVPSKQTAKNCQQIQSHDSNYKPTNETLEVTQRKTNLKTGSTMKSNGMKKDKYSIKPSLRCNVASSEVQPQAKNMVQHSAKTIPYSNENRPDPTKQPLQLKNRDTNKPVIQHPQLSSTQQNKQQNRSNSPTVAVNDTSNYGKVRLYALAKYGHVLEPHYKPTEDTVNELYRPPRISYISPDTPNNKISRQIGHTLQGKEDESYGFDELKGHGSHDSYDSGIVMSENGLDDGNSINEFCDDEHIYETIPDDKIYASLSEILPKATKVQSRTTKQNGDIVSKNSAHKTPPSLPARNYMGALEDILNSTDCDPEPIPISKHHDSFIPRIKQKLIKQFNMESTVTHHYGIGDVLGSIERLENPSKVTKNSEPSIQKSEYGFVQNKAEGQLVNERYVKQPPHCASQLRKNSALVGTLC